MQGTGGSTTTRGRAVVACTECHRRQKKCSQGQPCRNCARRYPPVACVYPPPVRRRSAPDKDATISLPSLPSLNLPISDQKATVNPSLDVTLNHRFAKGNCDPLKHLEGRVPLFSKPVKNSTLASSLENNQKSPYELVASSDCEILAKLSPAFGCGVVDILPQLKVEPTLNNAELFHIHRTVLSPWFWAIDGNPNTQIPDLWKRYWIPFTAFAPSVLHAQLFQAAEFRDLAHPSRPRFLPYSNSIPGVSRDLITLRGKSLSFLNAKLRSQGPEAFDDEAFVSVAYFLFNEWCWGIEGGFENVIPHIRGLRAMLKLRGGTRKLGGEGFISQTIMICQYQLAVVYERGIFALPVELTHDRFDPGHVTTDPAHDSPLFTSCGSFTNKAPKCGLNPVTGQMLDDMTFIINGVRSFMLEDQPGLERENILLAATEIQLRLSSLPPASVANLTTSNDFIYEICRITALIYLDTITNFVPFSVAGTPKMLRALFSAIGLITLTQWRPISGVWVYINLCVNPATEDIFPCSEFRDIMKRSGFHLVSWDWQCYVNVMETFILLQRWSSTKGLREPVSISQSKYHQALREGERGI